LTAKVKEAAMPTLAKSEVIFMTTRQKQPASISETAEWTSKIKVLVKQIEHDY